MWPFSTIKALKRELAIQIQLNAFQDSWIRELLERLDAAEANDTRDPKTGRYAKREAH